MDWGPPLRGSDEGTAKTLTQETLVRLRRDIVAGEFPAGAKVKSEDLKKRYGVGTSPIREALFQLVGDGLVRSDGQRGFRVAALRREELADIADWRARLECEALRRSIANGGAEWEAAVASSFQALVRVEAETSLQPSVAADRWEDLHRRFHFALSSACGSPWLLRFCELLIQNGERYRRAYIAYPRVASSIVADHAAILDATLARDADLAAVLLEAHIRNAAHLAERHATGDEWHDPAEPDGTSRATGPVRA